MCEGMCEESLTPTARTTPCSVYAETVARLASEGNLRRIPDGASVPGTAIDLSSNDYLGLASRPELQARFMEEAANRRIPFTSSASRLLAGRQTEYASLERLLEELYGRPALLFNSGYHANTGLVSALASEPGTLILADRLAHASIIDGITLSRAPFGRFRHNDMNHLELLIERDGGKSRRIPVLVESVYSMDGDGVDLDALVEIKRRHPQVILYVDEAHAFGVEGERGLGICRSHPRYDEIDVVVGTFGKACASMGAFAALSPAMKEYALNRSRSFIFSTALPPIQAAWTEFMIRNILDMDGERSQLKALGTRLGTLLGLAPGHIMPIMAGNPQKAVAMSEALLAEGFKVLPIRVPTVPPGTDRLRVSLSAALGMTDVERFADAVKNLASRI